MFRNERANSLSVLPHVLLSTLIAGNKVEGTDLFPEFSGYLDSEGQSNLALTCKEMLNILGEQRFYRILNKFLTCSDYKARKLFRMPYFSFREYAQYIHDESEFFRDLFFKHIRKGRPIHVFLWRLEAISNDSARNSSLSSYIESTVALSECKLLRSVAQAPCNVPH